MSFTFKEYGYFIPDNLLLQMKVNKQRNECRIIVPRNLYHEPWWRKVPAFVVLKWRSA